jgi:hypothetical protein
MSTSILGVMGSVNKVLVHLCLIERSVFLCCGLEAQNPIQALKSVKKPCNTYHLNLKWARTLPLGILQEIFIDPNPIS